MRPAEVPSADKVLETQVIPWLKKLLSDDEWFSALVGVVKRGRSMHKDVMLHTHFNHPNEITEITAAKVEGQKKNEAVIEVGGDDGTALPELFEVLDTPTTIYLIMENADGGEMFDYIVAHTRVSG